MEVYHNVALRRNLLMPIFKSVRQTYIYVCLNLEPVLYSCHMSDYVRF